MALAETKITPFLWFDGNIDDVVRFYTSVFPEIRVLDATPLSVTFVLMGQEFTAFNGGPMFKFTEAISFFIPCETQDDIDYYWSKLTDGGTEQRCGWLKDRFGLSWQVSPRMLQRFLADPDPKKAQRAREAMMTMKKIDIAALQQAHEGS